MPASILHAGNKIVTVSPGENKRLRCFVFNGSYPQPVDIFWKLNGSYIAAGKILQLRDISHNLTGVYECVAYNGFGIPATKTFHVTFRGHEQTATPLLSLDDIKIFSTSATSNSAQSLDVYKRVSYLLLGLHVYLAIF